MTWLLDTEESLEAISKALDLTLQGHTYLEAVAAPIEGGPTGRGGLRLRLRRLG